MNKAKLYFTAILLSTSAMASNSDDFNNDNNKINSISAPAAEASVTVVDMDQLLQARAGIEKQEQEARCNYEKHAILSDQLSGLLTEQLMLEASILRHRHHYEIFEKDSTRADHPSDLLEKLKRMQKSSQLVISGCEAKLSENKSIIEMLFRIIDEDPPKLPPAALKLLSATKTDLAKMRASLEEELKWRKDKKSYWYQEVVRMKNVVRTRLSTLSYRHVILQNELEKSRRQELELSYQTNTASVSQRCAH